MPLNVSWFLTSPQVLAVLYMTFFYMYLFFGATPTATINGTAVCRRGHGWGRRGGGVCWVCMKE